MMQCLQKFADVKSGSVFFRYLPAFTFSTQNKQPGMSEFPQDEDMPIEKKKNPFEKEKPKCILCKFDIEPNYKNVRLLSQFISRFTGRVYGRHITGLCLRKQEKLEKEIRKAQAAGLMAYYLKKPEYLADPSLYNIMNPLKPHKYL